MTSPPVYESIGQTYASTRQPDARIAGQIVAALGDAATVLNVGAGSGSYEPTDRFVVALDPSWTMLRQRGPHAAGAVQGVAEHLPFADDTFEATLAVLTLHHWSDMAAGLAEIRRVSRRQVVLLYETSAAHDLWIVDYFPGVLSLPHELRAPSADSLRSHLDVVDVQVVPVPHNWTDGFGAAYRRRPERYLDLAVQAGMSMLALLDPGERTAGIDRLRHDLSSGAWHDRYAHLFELDAVDLGYRLVFAETRPGGG